MSGQGSCVSVDLEEALSNQAPRLLRYVGARVGDASLAEEIVRNA